MKLFRKFLAMLVMLAVSLFLSLGTTHAHHGPTVFAGGLLTPVGVVADVDGNVWVTSDNVTSTLITKFAPDGRVLAQIPLGDFFSIGAIGKLAVEPTTGLLVDLLSTGEVLLVNPATGEVTFLFNIRQLNVDTTAIYDVASGSVDGFDGQIVPAQATYGDIALLRRDGEIRDVFITGHSGPFPFVMRIRIAPDASYTAKVLISSRASAAPDNNVPRGVAVNSQAVVVTTLPLAGRVGNVDRAVAFSADFPEGAGGQPQILLNGLDLTSRGMTTDAAGNFYVATGVIGSSICGAGGSGALVILPRDLNDVSCHPLGATLANSQDVAVSPDGTAAYMTVTSGAVLRFQ